ncbi:AEC family transporter [candidate division KSB1 bacterium]|nr:AEC family transporter [candidate division KSB1 bacterium]
MNNVAPVFLIVFLGYWIRRWNIIDAQFSRMASRFVFTVTLPALIFTSLVRTDFYQTFNSRQVVVGIVATLISYAFVWIVSIFFTHDGRDRGVFIQGSYRGNFAIIGFAIIYNLFGSDLMSNAAILLAFAMPLYNVLAVIALTVPLNSERNIPVKKIMFDILTNPLIIAALVSVPWSLLKVGAPKVMMTSLDYLAGVTLPLALVGIGASLDFHKIKAEFSRALAATIIKIVILPTTLTWFSWRLGVTGEALGILFILYGAPTAIASYIMAEAMGGNRELAANIVLISTLGSIFTLALGIYLLRSIGII